MRVKKPCEEKASEREKKEIFEIRKSACVTISNEKAEAGHHIFQPLNHWY